MQKYVTSPVNSNHSNLFNELLVLVQGRCGVLHAKVNGTGMVVGDRNGNTIRLCRSGRNRIGDTRDGKGLHMGEREAGE